MTIGVARPIAAWLAVAAMLSVGPVAATGKYVCTRGMAAAGPACPLCHGEHDSEGAHPQGSGPCCTYVLSSALPMAATAAFQLTKPLSEHHPCTPTDFASHVSGAIEPIVSEFDPRSTGPPSSPYRTTFLRL